MTGASADNRPTLFNPTAAAWWSLVFSPAFGAYLHMRNAETLSRLNEAKMNRIWFRGSLGYLVFACVSVFVPAIPDAAFRGASLGMLATWYYVVARAQIFHVRETMRGEYQPRSLTKPLMTALACLIAFMAIAFGLLILADSMGTD